MTLVSQLDQLDSQWLRWAGTESDASDLADRLATCFGRLTARAQLSLKLRFSEGASRENIAKELGITVHGAKNLMQRAKAQLKQCLDEKLNRE